MAKAVMDRIVIAEGETVFKQGARGTHAYVVQDGVIEISIVGESGDVVLGTVEKGGIFGEMALIDDQPRMATAKALNPATIIVIRRDTFNRKIATCDPFIRGLLGIFVKNIRRMSAEKVGG
jgi:CRP/FNR family cyclic AMP-dependent transcriptional regulator